MKQFHITIKTDSDGLDRAIEIAHLIAQDDNGAELPGRFSSRSRYGHVTIAIADESDLISRSEAAELYFGGNQKKVYSRIASGTLMLYRGDRVSKKECINATRD